MNKDWDTLRIRMRNKTHTFLKKCGNCGNRRICGKLLGSHWLCYGCGLKELDLLWRLVNANVRENEILKIAFNINCRQFDNLFFPTFFDAKKLMRGEKIEKGAATFWKEFIGTK